MAGLGADFSSSRLVFARSRAGLTRVRLAEAADVSTRTLAYYESGDHSPSAQVAERLAKVLNVPRAFFTGPPIDAMPAQSVSFRALSRMSAVRRDSALASGALAVEVNRWLENRL